jgi:uncharacterized delta-60 repeat protein
MRPRLAPYWYTLLTVFILSLDFFDLRAQSIDNSFNVDIKNFGIREAISAIAVQSDQKIIIGGGFYSITDFACKGLARLNDDGSVDQTFNASATVITEDKFNVIAIQSDGKVLVAGQFKRGSPIKSRGLYRFNANGTLDTSFQPDLPNSWSANAMTLQPDGKIIIGWVRLNPSSDWQYSVARLNTDGTTDPSFNCSLLTTKPINDIELQPDGKIIVVGGSVNGINEGLFKRFNTDGSDDTAFNATAVISGDYYAAINTVTVTPTSDILISGAFHTCNGVSRNGVAMMTSTGELNYGFSPDYATTSGIQDHLLLSSGKIILVGEVSYTIGGVNTTSQVTQLNANGTVDLDNTLTHIGRNYNTNVFLVIKKIQAHHDGKYFLMGYDLAPEGVPCPKITRINPNATIDLTFMIGPGSEGNEAVYAVAVQGDGKILVGGDFNYVDKISRNNLARLNPNGSLDPTFNPGIGVNGWIYSIRLQPDGKILVGGRFGHYNQVRKRNIIRLNSDGSLDQSFVADGNFEVCYGVALQSDGKIIMKVRADQQHNTKIIRLNTDGSTDIIFNTQPEWGVDHWRTVPESNLSSLLPIAIQADGKVITENLRFTLGGEVDATFNPLPATYFVALAAGNKLVMRGGNFNDAAEQLDGLHSVDENGTFGFRFSTITDDIIRGVFIQPNKKMIISTQRESYFAGEISLRRMNEDGAVDNDFAGFQLIPAARDLLVPHGQDLVLAAGVTDWAGQVLMAPLVRFKTNFRSEQTIQFTAPSDKVFDANPISLALAASTTSGLPISFSVTGGPATITGNTLTITGTGMITLKATQSGNEEFVEAAVTKTFFAKRIQQIDFPQLEDKVLIGSTVQVDMTGTSNVGLTISYQVISGPATVNGSKLTIAGTGAITVKAIQSGTDNYFSAVASQTFFVRRNQTITFPGIADQVYVDNLQVSLAASSSSSLVILYQIVSGPATTNGNLVNVIGTGKITVKAIQVGSNNFLPAEASQSFYARQNQSIAFVSVGDLIYTDNLQVTLSASSSSGIPVSYLVSSGSATVNGNLLNVTGTGKITVTAMFAGGDNVLPGEASQSFYARNNQSITFPAIADLLYQDNLTIDLSASSTSGLPVSYQTISGPATVTGQTQVFTAAGRVEVKARQQGDDHYLPAIDVLRSFCVNPPKPTITLMENGVLKSSSVNNNQWFVNGLPISTATQQTIGITVPGIYSVQVSIEGCNSQLADSFLVTGIETTTNEDIHVFPNPATTVVCVEFISQLSDQASLRLFDLTGRQVISQTVLGKNTLQVESLSRGGYILAVTYSNRIVYYKLILK